MHRKSKFFFIFLGLSLAALSALLRFWAFTQTPFANGWDSYFYLVQLKSIVETGQMHSPEASLIYPYLRIFYWITGDYVVGMKTGVAVLCGLWVGVVYGSTAFRPSGQKAFMPLDFTSGTLKAMLPTAIALFSPQLSYFAAQYPKNLLGLIFLWLFISSLQRAAQGKYGWLMPVLWLVLGYFGHRMTFGLAVVYLVLHLLFQFHWATFTKLKKFSKRIVSDWAPFTKLFKFSKRIVPDWAPFTKLFKFSKRIVSDSDRPAFSTGTLKKILFYGAIAVGLFLLAGQFFPGLAHIADSGRLQGVISATPQFAPWSFVQTFGFQRISAWWLVEIIGVTLLFLFAFIQSYQKKNWTRLPLLLLCGFLVFPFFTWSTTGFAWRCWMVFVLLVPLASTKYEVDSAKSVSGRSVILWRNIFRLCTLAIFIAAFFSWKSYQPLLHDPNYVQFQKITERTQQYFSNRSVPELVIAHNALAEYYTFHTGIDAMPWLPEYAIDSSRLWRIAAEVHLPTLKYFSRKENEPAIQNLGGHYYLLPEYVWQKALTQARAEQDSDFLAAAESWRNPSRMRPGWLLRRK